MASGIELAPLVCEIRANLDDFNRGIDEATQGSSRLEEQFKQLNNDSRLAESGFKLAGASAAVLGDKIGILASKQNELSDKIKLQSRAITLAKHGYEQAQRSLTSYTDKSTRLKEKLNDLTREHERVENSFGKNSRQAKNLQREINRLNVEYDRNKAAVDKAKNNLNNYNIKLNETQTELLETQNALNETNEEIKNTRLSNINEKLEKVSGKLKDLGSTLTSKVTVPILKVGKASFTAAMDLDDNLGKTDSIFKENSETVKDWSNNSLESMGMCQSSALELANKFGDMGLSMKLTSKDTTDYAINLAQLAADMSSYKNITIERANEALTGIYTGETKALKELGITMTDANLQQFASNEGIKKKINNMTQAELVQLRYNYVMSETKDMQNDFASGNDGASNSLKIFSEATKELSSEIGTGLLPMLTPIIQKATEIVKSFASMDEGTRNLIIKFGLVAAAAGPVLSTLGTGIGFLTKITPLILGTATATTAAGGAAGGAAIGFGALATVGLPIIAILGALAGGAYLFAKRSQTMNSSCLKSKEELGAVGSAFKALNGDVALTADEMDKMNIKHKEWSKKISPETQKALTETSDKIAKYNFAIEHASSLGKLADKKEGENLNKGLDEIINNAIKKIKERSPQVQKEMANAFKADDGTLDKNEKVLMGFFNKSQNEQVKKVEELHKKIEDIDKKAAQQQGKLTKDQLKERESLVNQIGQITMNNTVKNNQELIAAQAEFNARMKSLDMKGVSSLLSEKAKARDKEIELTRQKYDTQIEELKLYRPKMNAEEQKACDEQIERIKKLKNDAIDSEKQKYQGFLDEATKKYPELIDYIDTSNGKVMTNEEKSNYKRLTRYSQSMEGMMGITKSGYYKIKDTTENKMHECYVEVDEASGRIVGSWDKGTDQIYGNPIKAREDIDKDLKNGKAFQPIKENYDKTKDGVYKNAITVQAKKDTNLFKWIKDQWNGVLGWFNSNPVSPSTSSGGPRGSHYNGLDYVPYDGYIARLHKGERVLTAEENGKYSEVRTGSTATQDININIPVILEDRVIAKVVDKIQGKNLALEKRLVGR
ncbi:phage tail tape measure protein [[Clostridium] sordellii]|uniref:phage tail tape measure protein n=1 Tax=Paraclostridium sordellii TaxID=1505 RepID=UPI000542E21D|nr:phage tail tape measure protein [Paeniclostridium sordellii]CEK30256.1 phage tail tape measure protein [[Clostridium] sordellii] [Paeniclostridium sordellii]